MRDLADAVNLRGPASDIFHLNEADVHLNEDVLAGPAGIDLFKRLAGNLLVGAVSDGHPFAADYRVDNFAGFAGNMAIGERVQEMAVRQHAADRSDVLGALDLGDYRVAAADPIRREGRVERLGRRRFLRRRFHYAERDDAAIG